MSDEEMNVLDPFTDCNSSDEYFPSSGSESDFPEVGSSANTQKQQLSSCDENNSLNSQDMASFMTEYALRQNFFQESHIRDTFESVIATYSENN